MISSKMRQRAGACGRLPQEVEELLIGGYHPAGAQYGFHDHGGQGAARLLDGLLAAGDVVEWEGHHKVADRVRYPRPRRGRVVVRAVVATLEARHDRTPCIGPGQSHRGHRGFGSGVGEADLVDRGDPLDQHLGQENLLFGRR